MVEYKELFEELRKFIIDNTTEDIVEISFKYRASCGATEEYTYKINGDLE